MGSLRKIKPVDGAMKESHNKSVSIIAVASTVCAQMKQPQQLLLRASDP
jgi:hypothetical protein